MCRGHTRKHPCSHTSIKWLYCPKARFELATGQTTTPCRSAQYFPGQEVKMDCPLQTCYFKALGGSWMCCRCGQGPNIIGWCTAPQDPTLVKSWDEKAQRMIAMTAVPDEEEEEEEEEDQQQEGSPPREDDASYAGESSVSVSPGKVVKSWKPLEGYPEMCGHGCCDNCMPTDDGQEEAGPSSRPRKKPRKDGSKLKK